MPLKKIINADDFGISPGVNQAIAKGFKEGILNSTSIMITLKYAGQAVAMMKDLTGLNVGLHLNLTNEYPAADPKDIPLLVDENGKFKHGFVNLFLLSFFKPKAMRRQVEIEARAQLEKAQKAGIKLSHIDSHRHVHMIPLIFKIVKKLKEENGIERIRVVNENIFNTMRHNKDKSFLFDGGLVKYLVLKTLAIWNNYKTDTYFYTILYTCKISSARFNKLKISPKFAAIEIGIHPGMPDIDSKYPEDVFDDNILSPYRTVELETVLNKKILDEMSN